ncbi:MAG: DUF4258 domain-containing protein [Cyanobacterium sp. T60_A2020_053]|nr:DUF4258 domain-containing protein [Cyanobacterium sp. T60_A2020_053]
MKFSTALHDLIIQDSKINQVPEFVIGGNLKDENHAQRRMQPRAIDVNMIKVALAYGEFAFYSRALTWTLLDKCLRNTVYELWTGNLRGLRIIARATDTEESLMICTVYWDFDLTN